MRPRPPTSALDDTFVAQAAFVELAADQRHAMARRSQSRWRPAGRWMQSGPGRTRMRTVLVALAAGATQAAELRGQGPDRLRLVVAGSGGVDPDPSLISGAEDAARLAVDWLEQQVGGTIRGEVGVASTVTLPSLGRVHSRPADVATAAVLDEYRRHHRHWWVLPIVVTTARTLPRTGDPSPPCGMGGPDGIVVYLGNCPSILLGGASTFGEGVDRTIAHELVHAMWGVADCAPHDNGDGHVVDDPADLMYEGPLAQVGIGLDVGHDDYWGHSIDGCPDIADSVLWEG